MRIYFGEEYGGNAYVNFGDCDNIQYDCIMVGVEGLVELIELHVGIHHEPKAQIERQAQWLKCMRTVMMPSRRLVASCSPATSFTPLPGCL